MNKGLAGLLFHTRRGTQYFYDDNTGVVFPCPDVMYKILLRFQEMPEQAIVDALSNHYPVEKVSAYCHFVRRWVTEQGAFFLSQRSTGDPKAATSEQVQEHLSKSGFRQLILNVTEECNLRCRYCIFSEAYPFDRSYSTARMSWDVARRAVDYYFSKVAQVKKRNPSWKGVVTFYGGEPLLNFGLIRKVIEYVKSTYSEQKAMFNLTTNGVLLSDQIGDYLVDNDVAVSVSLDGPQEEHDRLRVFASGRGTFDKVYRNVRHLYERHSGYTAGMLLSCYDYGTDLCAVRQFFDEHEVGEFPYLARANFVKPHFSSYHDQYTGQDRQRLNGQLAQLRESYYGKVTRQEGSPDMTQVGYLHALVGADCRLVLLRRFSDKGRLPYLPYTGACVPGDKIAVDPDGTFHLCERITPSFPIGHVERGLDMDRIVTIITAYNEQMTTECPTCPVTRMCGICFSVLGADGSFAKDPPDICQRVVERTREQLSHTYSILEEKPDAYEDMVTDYHKRLAKTRVIDF